MKRFSQRCNRKKRVVNRYEIIPFSWTLLLIAVFHFSIWSIGVTESPARFFYAREIANCKQGGGAIIAASGGSIGGGVSGLLDSGLYSSASLLSELHRSIEKEVQSIVQRLFSDRIKEASKARLAARKKKKPTASESLLLSCGFSLKACNEESKGDEGAAAAAIIQSATILC